MAAAHQAAASSGSWQYSRVASLARQPGSGNNWAAGALGHAPAVRQPVLGMLRRQAERCDRLGGFLVMQARPGAGGVGLHPVARPMQKPVRSCCVRLHDGFNRSLPPLASTFHPAPRTHRAWRVARGLAWAVRW